MKPLKVLLGSASPAGHALPVIALGRALQSRGHEVLVQTGDGWADVVQGLGMGFSSEDELIGGLSRSEVESPWSFPSAEAAPRMAMRLLPTIQDFKPHVAVSDLFALVPPLAAERAGVPAATLIPHIYPVEAPGLPFFMWGLRPPRTPLGGMGWRALSPITEPGLRAGRKALNEARAELGLSTLTRYYGWISDALALVATYPQLEYPRPWPAHVHITGPMIFEAPHPEVALPETGRPMVLVAASTEQDPEQLLIRTTLEALADEPIDVVAVMNRRGATFASDVPANATVLDWISYSQAMPRAAVVISSGGHGTIVRALSEGVPVLVCPYVGDQAENGARAAWAGAGLMIPRRLIAPGSVRWAIRRLLADPGFTARARTLGAQSGPDEGAVRGAQLVERFAAGL